MNKNNHEITSTIGLFHYTLPEGRLYIDMLFVSLAELEIRDNGKVGRALTKLFRDEWLNLLSKLDRLDSMRIQLPGGTLKFSLGNRDNAKFIGEFPADFTPPLITFDFSNGYQWRSDKLCFIKPEDVFACV